ncbi:MAG TPA: DUF502 domain-containing protein [Persephonella sp.]|nr:DUF502 domain-containing protein [Hydrogenothermaceae bacterium]HIQ25478.1 DUF502 domain-containing protein [Persephonella sp.]
MSKIKEIFSLKYIRDTFLTGFFVFLPVALTIFIVFYILSLVNNLVLPYLRYILPIPDIPGMGVLTTLLLIFFTGLLTKNFLGKKLLSISDYIFSKIPLVRSIYNSLKQITESLFIKKGSFKKTVLVEFPRKGMLSLAFVANEIKVDDKKYYAVYVPTAPNPTSGYTIFVKEEEVIHTNLTVDEATKIILSGGLVIPKEVKRKDYI